MDVNNDKYRLAAKWFGEGLREISVLMVVFVPLDQKMGKQSYTVWELVESFVFALIIFGFGIIMGYVGEMKNSERS